MIRKVLKDWGNIATERSESDVNISLNSRASVFLKGKQNFSSLNVPIGASLTFLPEDSVSIVDPITVSSGEIFFVKGKLVVVGDLIVESGGEVRNV
jgi:hypothetical protein